MFVIISVCIRMRILWIVAKMRVKIRILTALSWSYFVLFQSHRLSLKPIGYNSSISLEAFNIVVPHRQT